MGLGVSSAFSKLGGLFAMSGETAVGLSIGTSAIKLVELQKSRNGWKLLHFGMIQLPDEAVMNREIVNPIAVTDCIKTLTQQIKLGSRQVCFSLSGTAVIIKRMSVEVPNPKDLQDAIFWEAEQYVPFNISEVVMDYQVLSRKGAQTDVLLVAVKKAVLDQYMSVIQEGGLRPSIADVDYFALQNVFEANYPMQPNEAAAIIDIGANAMKMVVVHNKIPLYTKDTVLGGRNLTGEIQRQLNLSYADAEVLKVGTGGGGTPQEVSDLVHIMCENYATEIKKALDFYSASSLGAPISYVLLTGGASKAPGLSGIVEEIVGKPTQILNPFNSIGYDPSLFTQDYLSAIGPLAAVPIGLALRVGTK